MKASEYVWGSIGAGQNNQASTDIEKGDNHVYFYSDVTDASILLLNRRLQTLGDSLISEAANQERQSAPIFLHVSSFGGSLLHGLAGLDAILRLKVPVITIVDGCCASAGTFLTIAGSKRKIGRHSFMLIHQLSAMTWGKYTELKDDQKNFDRFMKTIEDVYAKHTKIPRKMIDEILRHDLWFDATKCLKYGLVDEIL